jgi:hypothetical protein
MNAAIPWLEANSSGIKSAIANLDTDNTNGNPSDRLSPLFLL